MHMYDCMCMYVCIYVCKHIYMCVYTYAHTDTLQYIQICPCAWLAYIYIYVVACKEMADAYLLLMYLHTHHPLEPRISKNVLAMGIFDNLQLKEGNWHFHGFNLVVFSFILIAGERERERHRLSLYCSMCSITWRREFKLRLVHMKVKKSTCKERELSLPLSHLDISCTLWRRRDSILKSRGFVLHGPN